MTAISRIIHQIQEDCDDISKSQLLSDLSQTWIENHPKWQYKLWNIQAIKLFIKEYYPNIALMINDKRNGNIRLSDIAPYLILHKEGGLFVDSDFECIEPFDYIIKDKDCCLSLNPSNSKKNSLSASLIIAEKGHPFLSFTISYIESKYEYLNIGEYTILNEVYFQYPQKQDVELLPASKVNPCTEAEIYLYQSGLIADEDMEEKISDAISICYYKNEKETASLIAKKDDETDILYLSPIVGYGGAPNAAHRIHLGLRSVGVKSKMLVLESLLRQDEISKDEIHLITPEKDEIYGYGNDVKCLEIYPNRDKTPHIFSPAITGVNIGKYIDRFKPKAVQLHWVNAGLVKIEDLAKIKKKIVWRLPDCWAITGGCFYFGDCQRYLTGCGKCPKLRSDREDDLSREIWLRKEKAWKEMDLIIVVPTAWMKEVVENSTLLKEKDVFVIPNGLNLNKFYPIDKKIARKALSIPPDKKIILYGATNALNDNRKGCNILIQALNILPHDDKKDYLLVIFGADFKELNLDIPAKFMGYVHDHYILQTLYSAADIMVVPSLEEAFGQTVIEAMSCAVPVISFQNTGPAGIIEHKTTGFLAKYADSVDLAEGIKWLLEDESRLESLSDNSKIKIEETYDIKIIAQQYKRLYGDLF